MRFLSLLLVGVLTVLTAGCGSGHKAESVRKYCVLTEMSFQNAQQMRAIHDTGIKLFQQRKPYKKTAANRRVITAATALVTTAQFAAVQAENPKLFPGREPVSLGIVMAELITACRDLPKEKK